VPMAQEMGMGVVPWSPLASGLLTGKYTYNDLIEKAASPGSRAAIAQDAGSATERTFAIIDVVRQGAEGRGVPPSSVALAWLLSRPGVAAPLIGARSLDQLKANLMALEVKLDNAELAQLDEASAITLGFPHEYLKRPEIIQNIYGGMSIKTRT
ncbi:MAG: aldo/keto reductase, partial [Hoeflea sp.]|uniref:aldo/keto reductase n=1 Tax=Hoeflea sp. TaxID=1940281 RepID=UPI003296F122